jgi:hypothetical protein
MKKSRILYSKYLVIKLACKLIQEYHDKDVVIVHRYGNEYGQGIWSFYAR